MPRHLISDAHEWINEIPTVPTCYLAKPQPRERAWNNQRGKKTLLSSKPIQLSGAGFVVLLGLSLCLVRAPLFVFSRASCHGEAEELQVQ